jgi:hypothetical protein
MYFLYIKKWFISIGDGVLYNYSQSNTKFEVLDGGGFHWPITFGMDHE